MPDLSPVRFGARFHITDKNNTYDAAFLQKADQFVSQHHQGSAEDLAFGLIPDDNFGLVVVTNDADGRQDKDELSEKFGVLMMKSAVKLPKKSIQEIESSTSETLKKILKSYARKPNPIAQLVRKLLSIVGLGKPIRYYRHEIQ